MRESKYHANQLKGLQYGSIPCYWGLTIICGPYWQSYSKVCSLLYPPGLGISAWGLGPGVHCLQTFWQSSNGDCSMLVLCCGLSLSLGFRALGLGFPCFLMLTFATSAFSCGHSKCLLGIVFRCSLAAST